MKVTNEIANTPRSTLPQGVASIIPIGLPDWFSPGQGQAYLTNIDLQSDEGFALVMKAAVTKDRKLVDCVGQEIDVVNWFASPYEGIDEDTGEQVTGVRIALIDAAGQVYSTYSLGVRACLKLLMGRYGSASWNPPVRLQVKTTPAKLGQMLTLLPAPGVNGAPKKGKSS